MDCSTPGFLVLHYLPEFAQTFVIGSLWSHPLSPSSSPALNLPSIRVFTSGGQSLGLQHQSFMNVQDWFPLGLTSLIYLLSNGLSSLLQHHDSKASVLRCSAFFMVQLSHPFLTTWKITALTIWIFVSKVMSLLFSMLSSFIIAFLPRSKPLLISWLQSLSAVILKPKKIKSATFPTFSPSIDHEVMGPDAMILVFWKLSFKPAFSLSSFTFIKRLFSSSLLSAITVVVAAVQLFSRVQLFATPWTTVRPPCPSPSPRDCSKSCPLSLWFHPTILSSVIPFSSCLLSFPASGSFPMSWPVSSAYRKLLIFLPYYH